MEDGDFKKRALFYGAAFWVLVIVDLVLGFLYSETSDTLYRDIVRIQSYVGLITTVLGIIALAVSTYLYITGPPYDFRIGKFLFKYGFLLCAPALLAAFALASMWGIGVM